MDDKKNIGGNQHQSDLVEPQPIFDSSQNAEQQNITQDNEVMKPEEIEENVDVAQMQETETPPEEIAGDDVPPPIFEENKNKYLIIIGGVVVFLLIFGLFFKLLLGGRSSSGKVSLSYWGLWEDAEVFDPLIKDYQKKHPNISIKYEKMSPQDYLQKILARSREGRGPDIYRFHNTWLPQLKDIAASLPEQIMSYADFDKTFYEIHKKDLKIGKYYYGLPLEIDGLVLIINDDLFKKAGIATYPSNWDKLLDDVGKITTKDSNGQIITSGIALGTASNVEYFSDIFAWMLAQNGGDIKNLNNKEAVDILKSYREFAEVPNNFWDENMPNSLNAFAQEKVAMIFAPSWEVINIKAKNPDIKLKVVTLPSVPGGKTIALASYWVEGVSKYSKNQIEAWKFLKFLTEKENMTKLYESESKTRLFGEPYSRVDLNSVIIQNEYIGPVIQQAGSYKTIPLVSNTHDNALNDDLIKYLENAISSTINGVAYDQALKTASEGVAQVFNKYKIE